jgi:glycosyltransferase involved in cell wall biosynthesis
VENSALSEVLFSVVVACYNQEDFVKEAVESALFQAHPSMEVIVVDDASRDRTPDVLRALGASITFAPLAQNKGALAARNHGASLAKGEYLVFLDGDDVLMPGALEVYGRLIAARHPKLLLAQCARCYGNVPQVKVAELPCDIQFVEYASFLAKDRPWVYNTSSLIVERAAFWAAGGWSPGIFCQDIQDLLNKLGVSGKTILVLAPDTVWYRMHPTNTVRKVSSFIEGIYVLLAKARAGLYPGGRENWVRRSAWFGGLIFYWTKEAIRTGLYFEGLLLLASKGWMILLAMMRRARAWILGRKPVEVLRLERT